MAWMAENTLEARQEHEPDREHQPCISEESMSASWSSSASPRFSTPTARMARATEALPWTWKTERLAADVNA